MALEDEGTQTISMVITVLLFYAYVAQYSARRYPYSHKIYASVGKELCDKLMFNVLLTGTGLFEQALFISNKLAPLSVM